LGIPARLLVEKTFAGFSPFENKFIIEDKIDASGDPYADGYIQEVKEPPFFKNCEENNSYDDTCQKHQIERYKLAYQAFALFSGRIFPGPHSADRKIIDGAHFNGQYISKVL
jgi:hypothetical protein